MCPTTYCGIPNVILRFLQAIYYYLYYPAECSKIECFYLVNLDFFIIFALTGYIYRKSSIKIKYYIRPRKNGYQNLLHYYKSNLKLSARIRKRITHFLHLSLSAFDVWFTKKKTYCTILESQALHWK